MARCVDCKHYKHWPATYWEPADADCTKMEELPEEVIDHIFCNGEEFEDEDDPYYCPCYKLALEEPW